MANTVHRRRERPDRLFVPDKDPEFVYRWLNNAMGPNGDQNMYMAQFDGWELAPMDPDKLPPGILASSGQTTSTPGGVAAHRRGDLVLYRMRKERYKELEAEMEDNRKRQETTLDTMVLQANENAQRNLRDRGQTRIPGSMVFREEIGDPVD